MRLLHLTDLHISKDPSADENVRFEKALSFISKNKEAINCKGIVVTGDVTHHGEQECYAYFFSQMDRLQIPYHVFHGNHDDPHNMQHLLHQALYYRDLSQLSDNNWSLVRVNTVVPGEDYGLISDSELRMLERTLQSQRDKKFALFLHHHPVKVGTPLVDSCMLQNAHDFLSLCMDYNVQLIAAGHAHTPSQQRSGQIFISIAPALCYQWENGTAEVRKSSVSGFSVVSLSERVHSETYFI